MNQSPHRIPGCCEHEKELFSARATAQLVNQSNDELHAALEKRNLRAACWPRFLIGVVVVIVSAALGGAVFGFMKRPEPPPPPIPDCADSAGLHSSGVSVTCDSRAKVTAMAIDAEHLLTICTCPKNESK